MMTDGRTLLRRLFEAAVASADPMLRIPQFLPERPKGRLIIVGAGKASARMAEAVEQHYGPCEGLVITRYGYARPCQGIEIVEAAHPVPDDAGLAATRRMIDMLSGLHPNDHVLALVSGGASALLCAPADGVSLADKQALNAALLSSGATIGEMNVVRKHLSQVKGGQLAALSHPARVLTLVISDVPGDDLSLIGSGPTVGDASSVGEAIAILSRYKIDMAPSIRQALQRGSGVIRPTDPRLAQSLTHLIATPSQALQAAADLARAEGIDVRVLGDALEGEARDLGRSQARAAKEIAAYLRPGDPPVLILSGGECTVTRRADGVGGPNAEFALAAAIELDRAPGIHMIACDTDGVDGAAEVAGALVGPETLDRAAALGLSAEMALAHNDSHGFFGCCGAQVVTGPTLTNVNDFRAFLIEA